MGYMSSRSVRTGVETKRYGLVPRSLVAGAFVVFSGEQGSTRTLSAYNTAVLRVWCQTGNDALCLGEREAATHS